VSPGAAAARMCPLSLVSCSLDLPMTRPVVVLQEVDEPYRELEIPVGLPEGVAISQAWRRVTVRRPPTHELFADVLARFEVEIEVLRIVALQGQVYLAELVLRAPGRGREVVPCRVSDGLALILRQPCPVPITVDERVLVQVASIKAGAAALSLSLPGAARAVGEPAPGPAVAGPAVASGPAAAVEPSVPPEPEEDPESAAAVEPSVPPEPEEDPGVPSGSLQEVPAASRRDGDDPAEGHEPGGTPAAMGIIQAP